MAIIIDPSHSIPSSTQIPANGRWPNIQWTRQFTKSLTSSNYDWQSIAAKIVCFCTIGIFFIPLLFTDLTIGSLLRHVQAKAQKNQEAAEPSTLPPSSSAVDTEAVQTTPTSVSEEIALVPDAAKEVEVATPSQKNILPTNWPNIAWSRAYLGAVLRPALDWRSIAAKLTFFGSYTTCFGPIFLVDATIGNIVRLMRE